MKTIYYLRKNLSLILFTGFLFTVSSIIGQVNYCNTTLFGSYPSAIGYSTTATGSYSFAAGAFSEATETYSIAMGFYSNANYTKAIAIGSALKANAYKSIVIGSGSYNDGQYLENNEIESLVVGFNSKFPTLFVSAPLSQDQAFSKTGRIGIGNITSPQTKLHLKADEGEAAAFFIQPYNWIEGDNASVLLGTSGHGIVASKDLGLQFKTQSNYVFNDGLIKYGMDAKQGSVLVSGDTEGTAVWAEVSSLNLSPWQTSGTNDIYYSEGKVGIGAINNTSFTLAVAGSIITEEVMVKVQEDWYDFVFDPSYNLLPINQLSLFIDRHHHLPDVPSEKEVKESGFGLAEMNGLLLKKVEELTLYIIEQQKVLEAQQAEINQIKTKLSNE